MRKRSQIGIAGFAVALVTAGTLASVALAQPFFGTDGDDVITGTDRHDYITGRKGNDTLNALGRADLVLGGRGNDTVNTGDGNDLGFGGYDDDSVNGELGQRPGLREPGRRHRDRRPRQRPSVGTRARRRDR